MEDIAGSLDSSLSDISISNMTTAECARECFLHKCVYSVYDPRYELCLISFADIKQQCDTNDNRSLVFVSQKQVWIQCIQCGMLYINTGLWIYPELYRI